MPEKLNKLHFSKLPPIDPEIVTELERKRQKLDQVLKKGQQFLVTPQFNFLGECPNCGSREYFKLYGGQKDKLCHKCKSAY